MAASPPTGPPPRAGVPHTGRRGRAALQLQARVFSVASRVPLTVPAGARAGNKRLTGQVEKRRPREGMTPHTDKRGALLCHLASARAAVSDADDRLPVDFLVEDFLVARCVPRAGAGPHMELGVGPPPALRHPDPSPLGLGNPGSGIPTAPQAVSQPGLPWPGSPVASGGGRRGRRSWDRGVACGGRAAASRVRNLVVPWNSVQSQERSVLRHKGPSKHTHFIQRC